MNNTLKYFSTIRTKLLAAFLILSLIPFSAVGILSFVTSSKAISSIAFEQLSSIRETKKVQVENFFTKQQTDLGFLLEAVKSLKLSAFERLNTVQNKKKSDLIRFFNDCSNDIRMLSISGTIRNALYDFSEIIDSYNSPAIYNNNDFDKSMYESLEQITYNNFMRQFVESYKYYDMMLINKRGTVVFSTKRESELGQNIFKSITLINSKVVNCFAKAIRSANNNFISSIPVIIEDFQRYEPSQGRYIAFIAAPIYGKDGNAAGVVVLKIENSAINEILQNRQDMGRNGESYLISDLNGILSYRSDQVVKSGRMGEKAYDNDIRAKIDSNNKNYIKTTTAANHKTAVKRKNENSYGPVIEKGSNGQMEIVRYDSIDIDGLNWIMATSMSLEEEIAPAFSKKDDYFSRYADVYGFIDLMLISGTGELFYSVSDAPEYDKNISDDKLAKTGMGQLFQKISLSRKFGYVGFISSYKVSHNTVSFVDPIYSKPFAYIGEPLLDDKGEVEIIVALKIPLDLINQIMNENTGMNRSASSIYLVGTDGFSRSFLPGFSDKPDSPVLNHVKSEAVTDALAGITNEKIITDYRGVEVLSAYAPLNIFNTKWAIIAEIDKDEAFSGLRELKRNTLLLGIFAVFLIILISALIARHFAKPIAELTKGVYRLKYRDFDTTVSCKTNDELEILAQAFNEMSAEIKRYSVELESKAQQIKSYSDELESKMDILQKTEADLRKTNIILKSVMNGTTDAIFVKDIEGRHILANNSLCEVFNTTPEEIIGKKSEYFILPDAAEKMKNNDKRVLESGRDIMSEFERVMPDGSTEWWFTNKGPYRDSDGNIIGIIGISRNVTEQKLAEQEKNILANQLRQSQKMEAIGTLAAGVAHDFNNILSAIQGYSEIVMYELSDYSPEKISMEKVLYACNRAKHLIRQILTFSRTSTEECLVRLNIYDILQETLQLIRASIPTTIEIVTNINKNCGYAIGDSTQIHQVIMNLCTNASHAMDEKGGVMTVSLDVEHLAKSDLDARSIVSYGININSVKPGNYIVISVSDTGSGIAPEHIERIFDPYFTTKPPGKGAGMGLAVTQGIVQKRGGMITVESKKGEGTTFKVWLPQLNEEAIISNEPVCSSINDNEGISYNDDLPRGEERILVVDDEPDLIEITTHRLETLGYTVTGMTNSSDALIIFESMPDKFDLIITDQTMPKLTGAELVEKIIDIREDMPVILCTGYSTKVDAQRAEEIGIKAFLIKPVDYRELAFTVRKVLDSFLG
ncbi:MAG: ATP-binding protein [Desulfamplus sp.]